MRNAGDSKYSVCESTMKDKFNMTVDENIFLARKILVGNIHNAAKLEGVNTTFPETQAILDGVNVPGAKLDDIRVILNLRDAWRNLLGEIKTAKIDLALVKRINADVSRNESLAWGKLRTGRVGVAGTNHKPPVPNEKEERERISKIVSDKKKTATGRAITLMLHIMHSQLFWDGNKRTATIAANAVLIQNGCGVLSVAAHDIVEFNSLLKHYYDTGGKDRLERMLYEKAVIDFESVCLNEEVCGQAKPEVTPEVGKLLAVMDGELSAVSLRSRLRLKAEKNFRVLYVRPALEAGLIERTIPDKPNSRLQKYRLTAKGKSVPANATR
jgi:hypothetical protein